MKIIVIGAGIGGLVAAQILGKSGHEVKVIEKSSRDNWGYDWHDDVCRDIFEELNLPTPDTKDYFIKDSWTFVTPNEKVELFVESPQDIRDYSIERRALANLLAERAAQYATLQFACEVKSLIIESSEVKGVIVNGEKLYADLVIDNSGVYSPFRSSLPDSYNVEKKPAKNEVFYAYRGFHKRAKEAPNPVYTNKVYLKHIGEEGISWCIADPSGLVNILVGRIGSLPKDMLNNAYNKLKESNPIISDEVVRGGGVYAIPVRHPALRFGGNGYALIGDSAFMTIPMMGSGIANSMLAATMLADEVVKAGNAKAETIWNYQVRYYKKVGFLHTGADLLKRWMLFSKAKDIDFLLEKGVIDKTDLQNGSTGKDINLTLGAIIDKIKKGFPKISLLLSLKSAIDKGNKASKVAYAITETYDPVAIDAWERKIKKYFL